MLNSVLDDLKEDEERTFTAKDDGYVFTSSVHYPNNKSLIKQNVYMNKDSKVTKVEVVDDDENVLISMNYKTIEYDKKFDDDYFELNSIINTEEDDDKNKNDKNSNSNSSTNEERIGSTDNNITNNNTNDNTNTNSNSNETETETKETLSIEDVIYPMYLPDNTYLTSQERIDTESGERLILTFGGDNSFVLVEETMADSDSNLIIPVSGEFDFLSDVIGVIGTNSVMWHSNGIEYYMTSNTIETSVLVDIARSISVLPVSK